MSWSLYGHCDLHGKKPTVAVPYLIAVTRMMMTMEEGYDLNRIHNSPGHIGVCDENQHFFLFRFLRNKLPLGNAFVWYRLPPSPRFVKVDMDLAAAALRAWYIISHGCEGDLQD